MKDCRKHHFTSYERCSFCRMQRRYYIEGMATLNSWSEADKRKEREYWEKCVDNMKCELHEHKDVEE